MTTFKELEQRAKRESDQSKARLRENYSYARSLGFTSSQAKIMSQWSKERIDQVYPPPIKKVPKKLTP